QDRIQFNHPNHVDQGQKDFDVHLQSERVPTEITRQGLRNGNKDLDGEAAALEQELHDLETEGSLDVEPALNKLS
ncbi:hypothetical protein L9G16_23820, partial [Shewanella sp. A25]|nr:hypothetical protein [Shewanella shenzhenensis]